MRSKNIVSLFALTLMLGAGAACKNKDKDGTSTPGGKGAAGAALDPTKANEEAKKDFRKVAERYDKASKPLSKSQCETFAKDFKKVYVKWGEQMTVAWFNAGAAYEECGEVEKAVKEYEGIIAKVPKYDLAYNNLGVIWWGRSNESKALSYFKKAVDVNPKTRAPRNNLAAALRDKYSSSPQQSDFDKAENQLQSVLAVDSANRLAYENLARLYYDRGRLKDKSYLLLADLVVTQAIRVLKDDNKESADLNNIKGLLFMQNDNQVDALKAFKKAAELEPNHADANMNIAMISIRFRDYQQAEKSIIVALKNKRQKKNIETYIGLGVAQRGLRKYAEAEKSFKKAASVNAKDPRPLYNLGILYQEHIATASEGDGIKENKVARDYFSKFVAKAGSGKDWSEKVDDAKNRVQNIDQYFKDIEEMKKLEAEAKKLEALQKKQEEEERKRLLELEKKAAAAAAGASE